MFGLDIGYISGVESMQSFRDDVNNGCELDEWQLGFVTSVFSVGAILGSFSPLVSWLLEGKLGRKFTIALGGALFSLGAVIQATVYGGGLYQMYLGRFLSGISIGFMATAVPMYQGEVAPKQIRGKIVAMYQLSITFGILVAFWINVGLQDIDDGWRFSIWIQIVPGILLAVGMIVCMPRSPRWLVKYDRMDEALRVLEKLNQTTADEGSAADTNEGGNRSPVQSISMPNIRAEASSDANTSNQPESESDDLTGEDDGSKSLLGATDGAKEKLNPAQRELDSIVEAHRAQQEMGKFSLSELCEQGNIFLGLLVIGCTVQLLQQLVGMNVFMYYGPVIFGRLGSIHAATEPRLSILTNASIATIATTTTSNATGCGAPLSAGSGFTFNAINGVVNFVSTFPGIWAVDRFGRTLLMKLSGAGMLFSCMMIGILGGIFFEDENAVENYGKDAVVAAGYAMMGSIYFFVFNFAYGWGPVAWVFCGEIFPMRGRSLAMGLTTMTNWIGNLVIAQLTPPLLKAIGFNSFFLFAAFCALSVALAFFLPETKGVPLEEVPDLFRGKIDKVKQLFSCSKTMVPIE